MKRESKREVGERKGNRKNPEITLTPLCKPWK
jgi:hypothetical protein